MDIAYEKVPIESGESIDTENKGKFFSVSSKPPKVLKMTREEEFQFEVEEFCHVCKYKGILDKKIQLYLEEIDEWAKNCLEGAAKKIAVTEKINYDQAVFIVIGYILKALTLEEPNKEIILICKKKLFSLS